MKKGVQHKIMTSLLRMDEKYLIALSGGADSVFLFVMMKMMGYTIEAVHCNFHLRGKESDGDEAFCKLGGNVAEVVIPFGVTSLGKMAFWKDSAQLCFIF